MRKELNFGASRVLITRILVSYFLLFLAWRWFENLMPGQWHQPTLFRLDYDYAMWILKTSGLFGLLSQPVSGSGFTAALFISGLLLVIYPTKRLLAILFAILYFIQASAFNTFVCFSTHHLYGSVILLASFCTRGDGNFSLWWQAVRYYFCYAYASAFLWKVLHGSLFDWNTGIVVFRANLSEYFYHFPNTTMAHVYTWFMNHPFMVNLGHKVVIIAEGVFLIGFVTRKMDWLLIALAFFIFISNYFFVDVFFIEFLALALTMLKPETWMHFQRVLTPSPTTPKPLKTHAVAD